jgi:phosphoglucosamine mutase
MKKYFGTDGIRGQANRDPMTAEIALRVGMAAGREHTRGDHRHRVVIGKDTRLSGYMIEPALTAGFTSVGMDVILVGPMPTPAVAMLTRSLRADLGVMISASHNPYQDNGIKLFGADGYKLSDAAENAIEARMDSSHERGGLDRGLAAPAALGRARRLDDAEGRYIEFAKSTFPRGARLDGLKVVLDCANGAAYKVAPLVLWELGAEVIPVGVTPDGLNINENCGSTSPEKMCADVVAHSADIGIALDGDADRLLIADEHGDLLDGDQLMAMIARRWHEAGRLKGGGITATVMSNLALEHYLEGLGLTLHRVDVGDRHVVAAMRENGCNVGGEQSGHIILSDFATTGDGLIAALQVLSVVAEEEAPVSTVVRSFVPLPQTLRNVAIGDGAPLEDAAVRRAIADGEERLGTAGRLLIRKSGTEPVIRVMVEARDETLVGEVVGEIVGALEQAAP